MKICSPSYIIDVGVEGKGAVKDDTQSRPKGKGTLLREINCQL